MKQLVEKLNAEIAEFVKNAEAQVVKGNKAAGARARKAALALMKISRNSVKFPWKLQSNSFCKRTRPPLKGGFFLSMLLIIFVG